MTDSDRTARKADHRKGEPTLIGEWLGTAGEKYHPALKALEERQARQRRLAVQQGRLALTRRYTREQVDHCFHAYGLDPEGDFVTEWVPLSELPEREYVAEMERAAAGTNPHGTPLKRVLRWRLNPERFDFLTR